MMKIFPIIDLVPHNFFLYFYFLSRITLRKDMKFLACISRRMLYLTTYTRKGIEILSDG
jgi:hypothetical protein